VPALCRLALQPETESRNEIQITRDFCDHSNAVCEQCRFPELIAGWSGGAR
jgi:hypothetical protein